MRGEITRGFARFGLAGGLLLVVSGCMATSKAWKVLKDPSIPVGLPQDQPSTVALSLVAAPVMNATSEPALEQPPLGDVSPGYRVRLSSTDLGGLLGQLRMTTRTLQAELEASGAALPDHPVVEKGGDAKAEVESIDHAGNTRPLGRYGEPATTEDSPPEPGPTALEGSPLRVRVFQLKDDGVFLSLDIDALLDRPDKSLGKTYLDHDDFVIKPDSYRFVPFHGVQPHTRFIAVVASYQDPNADRWRAVHRIQSEGRVYPLLVALDADGIRIKSED